MKVLMLRPPTPGGDRLPPLSLGYLAAPLRGRHRVVLCDGLLEPFDADTWDRRLRRMAPDVVCCSISAPDLAVVPSLAARVLRTCPETRIIIGGPQLSAAPEETMRRVPEAEFGLIGEADHALPLLVDHLAAAAGCGKPWGDVPGLVWREGGALRMNRATLPGDLDALEVAWELLPPARYGHFLHEAGEERLLAAPIITSRGCDRECAFCAGPRLGGRLRRRSLESVVDEIRVLTAEFGVRGIEILDEGFAADREYLMAFCEVVRSEFPQLRWSCPNGVHLGGLDAEALELMRRAGCISVSVGIDSCGMTPCGTRGGDTGFLAIRNKLDLVRGAGIVANCFTLLGLPGEQGEVLSRKVREVCELPVTRATFCRFQAYAGTRYHLDESHGAPLRGGERREVTVERVSGSVEAAVQHVLNTLFPASGAVGLL